jgi:hypothetical protein
MLFKPTTLAVLLYAYAALAQDEGLLTSCNSKTVGQACKKCLYNDTAGQKSCYRGICNLKPTGRRVCGNPLLSKEKRVVLFGPMGKTLDG